MRVVLDPEILDLLRARLVVAHRAYPSEYGPDFSWKEISVEEHVEHALAHLQWWMHGERGTLGEDHLVHALARVYLAVAVQQQERNHD